MKNVWGVVAIACVLGSVFTGCTASPEKACKAWDERRKKLELTSGEDIVKDCTSELTDLKKRDDKAYACAAGCMTYAEQEMDLLMTCPWSCENSGSGDQEESKKRWQYGIASDASGAWAKDKKSKSMSDEECTEAGWVIAQKKLAHGVIDTYARQKHSEDLARDCKKQKKDESAVALYKCMRTAKDKDALFNCNGAASSNVNLIEGCVTKCSAGNEPASPAYMSCFNDCKAGK